MSTQMDIFDGILTDDMIDFEGGNSSYIVSGNIIQINANEWVMSREKVQIGDREHEFNVRYRFRDPILTSIALRVTNTQATATSPAREGRRDFNGTVVSNRDLEIEVSDGNWVGLDDFVVMALRRANPTLNRSKADLLLDLRNYGFDPLGRLPMYLQHLGADEEQFAEIATHFLNHGARDQTERVQRRAQGKKSHVRAALRHDDGLPIHHLEISQQNRALSATGTGFIGFLDGAWNMFTTVVAYDRKRTAIKKILAHEPNNMEAAQEEARIREIFSSSTALRPFHNWGGITTRTDVLTDNPVQHFPQQVPCGRFSVLPVGETQPVTYSVWTSRDDAVNRSTIEGGGGLSGGTEPVEPPGLPEGPF